MLPCETPRTGALKRFHRAHCTEPFEHLPTCAQRAGCSYSCIPLIERECFVYNAHLGKRRTCTHQHTHVPTTHTYYKQLHGADYAITSMHINTPDAMCAALIKPTSKLDVAMSRGATSRSPCKYSALLSVVFGLCSWSATCITAIAMNLQVHSNCKLQIKRDPTD